MIEPIDEVTQELDIAVTDKPAKTKEITIPILDHFKRRITNMYIHRLVSNINEQLEDGTLSRKLKMPLSTDYIKPEDVEITQIACWRVAQTIVVCDLVLSVSLMTQQQTATSNELFCSISFSIDDWNDFEISEIVPFPGELPEHLGVKLDSVGLPVFWKKDIPQAAVDVWDQWRAEALTDAMLRQPTSLAVEAMGLRIEERKIHGCKDQPYILFFEKDTIKIDQPRKIGQKKAPPPKSEDFEAGTIVINQNAEQPDNGDLAIYEACFEYHWHYIFYCLQGCRTTDKHQFKMEKKIVPAEEVRKNPLNFLWNRIGGMELMLPRQILSDMAATEMPNASKKEPEVGFSRHKGSICKNLAVIISSKTLVKTFRVKQRLIECGRMEAKGILNWESEEKGYVPSFAASDSYSPISSDETFFISRNNLERLYQSNEDLRKKLMTGDYVHVNGLVCLNDDAFVRAVYKGTEKTAMLTPWANAHVDECCLLFKKTYPEGENFADYDYIPDWNERRLDEGMAHKAFVSKEQWEKCKKKYVDSMPDEFGAALFYLMRTNLKGTLTVPALVREAGISAAIIDAFLQGRNQFPTFEEMINLCIGMNLPSWIAEPFLNTAGLKIPRGNEFYLWGLLLDCYSMLSVKEAWQYIRRHRREITEDEENDTPLKVKGA